MPRTAVINAGVTTETGVVVAENVADDWPAGTVTVAGTVMLGSVEDNETTEPPGGAGNVRVIVPVVVLPP